MDTLSYDASETMLIGAPTTCTCWLPREEETMQQNNKSNFPITTSTSASSPELPYLPPPVSLPFPGSLKLNSKLLNKGGDRTDYEALYNLRYQVYCHEAHFLNPADYPDGLEYDQYDAVSEHFIATGAERKDGIVGTVRLVRWTDYLSFPTSEHFPLLLEKLGQLGYPLGSTAEISRLCISKTFRRRTADKLLCVESFADGADKRRKFPVIILQLFKGIYLASKYDLGISHFIATFEDCLYRLLARYGVHFEMLSSDEIDYYGKVKIYGASIKHLEKEMVERMPQLYSDFFSDQSSISLTKRSS